MDRRLARSNGFELRKPVLSPDCIGLQPTEDRLFRIHQIDFHFVRAVVGQAVLLAVVLANAGAGDRQAVFGDAVAVEIIRDALGPRRRQVRPLFVMASRLREPCARQTSRNSTRNLLPAACAAPWRGPATADVPRAFTQAEFGSNVTPGLRRPPRRFRINDRAIILPGRAFQRSKGADRYHRRRSHDGPATPAAPQRASAALQHRNPRPEAW